MVMRTLMIDGVSSTVVVVVLGYSVMFVNNRNDNLSILDLPDWTQSC